MAQTGMRDIRRRIKSIKSTMQITKGMELVAAAKLAKARKAFETAKPYSGSIAGILKRMTAAGIPLKHPLLSERDVRRELFILITSDRGLCGGYNVNLIREVISGFPEGMDVSFLVTGIRGADYLRAKGYGIVEDYTGISDAPRMEHAEKIADKAMEMFTAGAADRVTLAYNRFVSTLSQQPALVKLFPVMGEDIPQGTEQEDLLSFEPSYREVVDALIPLYIRSMVYGALMEASASEQAARRLAMGSATENAKNMIEELTLAYNRARQELITREISEITGGAEVVG